MSWLQATEYQLFCFLNQQTLHRTKIFSRSRGRSGLGQSNILEHRSFKECSLVCFVRDSDIGDEGVVLHSVNDNQVRPEVPHCGGD